MIDSFIETYGVDHLHLRLTTTSSEKQRNNKTTTSKFYLKNRINDTFSVLEVLSPFCPLFCDPPDGVETCSQTIIITTCPSCTDLCTVHRSLYRDRLNQHNLAL